MKTMKISSKLIKITTLLMVLMIVFSGCTGQAKYDSPEAMISDMIGTYEGTGTYADERVIITSDTVIKYSLDSIFQEYEGLQNINSFIDKYAEEDWEKFDLNALLDKNSRFGFSKSAIEANIYNSTISGLWINKDGVLFSSEVNGYELKKVSSDTAFPTEELTNKFGEYSKYLQEYEKKLIIENAGEIVEEKKETLDSVLESATETHSVKSKCNADSKTVGNCAFESMLDYLKYPRSASLLEYSSDPICDDYGRVMTVITVECQNGLGNYITPQYVVALQSCSISGVYEYKTGGVHYANYSGSESGKELIIATLMILNDWDKDPNFDLSKDSAYTQAVELAKEEDYSSAIEKLSKLGDYRESKAIIKNCKDYMLANDYCTAVNLFSEGKYSEAVDKLSDYAEKTNDDILQKKINRLIFLCNIGQNKQTDEESSSKENNSSGDNESGNDNTSAISDNSSEVSKSETTQSTIAESTQNSQHTNVESDPQTQSTATASTPQTYITSETPTESTSQAQVATTVSTTMSHTTTKAVTEPEPVYDPCENGHSWMAATCTRPATCSVCKKTSGSALPHEIDVTKCCNCDYTDFSLIAKTYNNVSSYDLVTGEEFDVQKFSISSKGILSFTFDGKKYDLKLVQKTYSYENYNNMAQFDCYINGKKEPDALVEVDTDYYIPRLEWNYFQGHSFYIFAEE